MMMQDKQGEVDGGAQRLGGALLSSARTTWTSGTNADKHFGRGRDVAHVPIGTRAQQEATEAGEEGTEGDGGAGMGWRGGIRAPGGLGRPEGEGAGARRPSGGLARSRTSRGGSIAIT